MKFVLEHPDDVKAINWLNVGERIMSDVRDKIVAALREASEELPKLKPGESKTININIGHIEISKEAEKAAREAARQEVA